jgi:hypothetical protein
VETVIDRIASTQAGEKDKKQLTAYYQNNKKRMRYAQYRTVGCGIIGSGAIEFAHRTVIQNKNETLGRALEYGRREKHALTEGHFHEQAMVKSHRFSQIATFD